MFTWGSALLEELPGAWRSNGPSMDRRDWGSQEGRRLVELEVKVPSLSPTPQVLICRNYRGDVDMSEVEHFMPILMEKEEEGMLSPILAHGGVRFMWIKHNNLYRIPLSGGGGDGSCVGL